MASDFITVRVSIDDHHSEHRFNRFTLDKLHYVKRIDELGYTLDFLIMEVINRKLAQEKLK